MSDQIDTSNEQLIRYKNTVLAITVLGGVRTDHLDRMRVTLKVEVPESPRPAMRHSLDLYNDAQSEKFIRRCAERLEVGTSVIAASLGELTEQLESYRLEQIKKTETEQITKKELTKEEVRSAQAFLAEPNLLERTNELIGQSGVVGEERNRLLMFLIFTSRKQNQPLHIVSLGSSGAGKTHLQEKVGELIPEEDRIEITTLSENAFYYFERRALANKLILIEDLDGAESSLFPLRELQSKKRISKTIAHKTTKGETRAIHLVVEGPVSVAGCTTRESIYEDNANRSFLIYLDESEEQDSRVMEYQRAASAGKIDKHREAGAASQLRNVQRLLEPIKVVNPFAEGLHIPKEVLKPRRTNNHYLQFIEAVTFYHQMQREQKPDEETGEIYIETTLEDVKLANALMKEVLLRKSDELSGACRNYFERLKSWLKQEGKSSYTNREARAGLRINPSNQKRYNLALSAGGLIEPVKGKSATGYSYRIVSKDEYQQLKTQISTALDEALEKAKQSGGSQRSTRNNEPPKAVKTNKKKQAVQ